MILKNAVYDVVITDLTHDAKGVAKIDGNVVFVADVIIGEVVRIKIIKVNKSYAVGKCLEIIKKSSNRLLPFCPSFKQCGGCHIQHMDYNTQCDFKTNVVRQAVQRIGQVKDANVNDILKADCCTGYRNKSIHPITRNPDLKMGFFCERSHKVVDIIECGIAHNDLEQIRTVLKNIIDERNMSIYDESTHTGLLRNIMLRVGVATNEIMVVFVLNGNSLPFQDEILNTLKKFSNIKTVLINVNREVTNVVLGRRDIILYGNGSVTDYIGRYKFQISAQSFFQVNPKQTYVLYDTALKYANMNKTETVVDLFCGIGTISLFFSSNAKKVIGVEKVSVAIDDAKLNAAENHVDNVEFICGDAAEQLEKMYDNGTDIDVVVLDPPRKGCGESLLRVLCRTAPKKIIYISCNPSTLARDLNFLTQNKFCVVEIQPVDMFPQTYHVETIALLQRRDT